MTRADSLALLDGIPSLILASASPRRRELLDDCGFKFSVVPADVDETPLPAETPAGMVRRLAEVKARTIGEQFPGAFVIGADTTVVVGGEMLGKPKDQDEAISMLSRLSGNWHEVITGCAVVRQDRDLAVVQHWVTRVLMRALSAAEIATFVATGEAYDKAGAYAIQGRGAHLVSAIEGSYTNVVGLNVAGLLEVLRSVGAAT